MSVTCRHCGAVASYGREIAHRSDCLSRLNNVVMIDRIKGVPANQGTPESDADPRNPNLPPEFAALGIAQGESVLIPRSQYEALVAAIPIIKSIDMFLVARGTIGYEIRRDAERCLAALRAAGTGEGK